MNQFIPQGKKIYFASDFHLGAPNHEKSLIREKRIIRWLESIRQDAEKIFLVGDIFDFWFEYREAVPRGYVRLLGKLAELSDSGIEIIVFLGNHDMWMTDYFEKELKIKTFRRPKSYIFNQKKFYIGHGDGLGKGDWLFKILKIIFEGKIPRFLFGRVLHPNLGLYLGNLWAKHSWNKHNKEERPKDVISPDNERLLLYSKQIEAQNHHDYYVFGHIHNCIELRVSESATYFNLGDWVVFNSYLVFDGEKASLEKFMD
jgi:UDP-2,3-diacylglucosamine hydrolase